MNISIEEIRKEFIEIYKKHVKRDGADKLLEYLESCDFFVGPASGKRHNVFEGGLAHHSINVYKRFKRLIELEFGEDYNKHVSDESVAIMGLLHDLCKANTYVVDYRNKKENGQWIQVPYYAYNNSLPYGHGEKSVYIISGFMRLTREEAIAINWHMGGFDPRSLNASDMSDAYFMYPGAVLLHTADMQATYIDEERPPK